MKNRLIVFTMFVSAILSSCSNNIAEQSHWRGPQRDGIYPDQNLLTEWPENGPDVAWKYDQLGKGYSSPAFTSDGFYITGTPDTIGFIYAFDPNGELKWKKEYGPEWMVNFPGSRANVTIYGDLGYLMSSLGVVYCFDTKNGENVWSVDLMKEYDGQRVRFGITEVLLVDENKVYCTPGGPVANVISLDRFTGDLIWQSRGAGTPSTYCPSIFYELGDKKYFCTITLNNLLAVDTETGEVTWTYPMQYESGIHANSPVYRDGYIFVMDGWEIGSFKLKISEDGRSAHQVWHSKLLDIESGDAILIGDRLYAANWDQKGYSCLDWNTGEELFTNKEFISGTQLYADGLFYWYEINGKIGLVKATDNAFEIISSFQLEGGKSRDHSAHPVIHDKKLYIRYGSTLWAYDVVK